MSARADGNLCCFVGQKGATLGACVLDTGEGSTPGKLLFLSEAAWKKDFYILGSASRAVEIVCARVLREFISTCVPS